MSVPALDVIATTAVSATARRELPTHSLLANAEYSVARDIHIPVILAELAAKCLHSGEALVFFCRYQGQNSMEIQTLNVDLFIKKVPHVVKELISREAMGNHRSINQEAIALLEEALVQRVAAMGPNRRTAQSLLEDYAASPGSVAGLHASPRN